MTLELEFGHALCYCTTFIVNGIDASSDDFGEQGDIDPSSAEPYGCGDMHFTPNKKPKQELLDKYGINLIEYEEICDKLEEGLSFGCCGWCV
jgi:hypothetical protein